MRKGQQFLAYVVTFYVDGIFAIYENAAVRDNKNLLSQQNVLGKI